MTTNRHHAAPMRARRGRSTADRVLSAGLATAACVGVVGVLGVRGFEDSSAAQQDVATQAGAATLAVSSAGLTEAQLDTYAAQLAAEGAKLDAYRAQLTKVAKDLKKGAATQGASTTSGATATTTTRKPRPAAVPAPKPAPKPVAKPAPKPAAQPQSNTKSS